LLNCQVIHLDDIVWENGEKRNSNFRKEILSTYLSNSDNQVYEGSSHSEWMHALYRVADMVILLKPSVFLAKYRIIKRYLKKKFHLEKGHKESLKYVKNLFKIFDKYQQDVIPEILANPIISDKLHVLTDDRKTYKLFL